jgi:hypothetical protein
MKRIVVACWAIATLGLMALIIGDDWQPVRASIEAAPARGALILAVATVFGGCVVAGIISWGFAFYHMIGLMLNWRPGTFWFQLLLGPIALFINGLWTEQGLYHRRRLAMSVMAFLIAVAAGLLVHASWGPSLLPSGK